MKQIQKRNKVSKSHDVQSTLRTFTKVETACLIQTLSTFQFLICTICLKKFLNDVMIVFTKKLLIFANLERFILVALTLCVMLHWFRRSYLLTFLLLSFKWLLTAFLMKFPDLLSHDLIFLLLLDFYFFAELFDLCFS